MRTNLTSVEPMGKGLGVSNWKTRRNGCWRLPREVEAISDIDRSDNSVEETVKYLTSLGESMGGNFKCALIP